MNKEEFAEEVKKQKQELSTKIDSFKVKISEASEDMKEEYAEQLEQLKVKKEALGKKYDEVIDMAEDKWDDVKDSFSEKLTSFSSTVKNLFK